MNDALKEFYASAKASDKIINDLMKQDKKAKDAGKVVGRVIEVSVADGSAYYEVIKENKKTVKIRWVPGIHDEYRTIYWGKGETLIQKRTFEVLSY
jgi:predicted  nucleic acid-binding Zn ribbon protein